MITSFNKVFELWNDLCKGSGKFVAGTENVSPDIITVSTVMSCLDSSGDDKKYRVMMDSVFSDAVEKEIIFPSESMDTEWEIDLSGMSLPVARAAIRYIVSRLPNKDDLEDLNLITGVGRHHYQQSKFGSTALRDYVKEILHSDFDPPLSCSLANRAEGMVLIEKKTIEEWLLKSGALKNEG